MSRRALHLIPRTSPWGGQWVEHGILLCQPPLRKRTPGLEEPSPGLAGTRAGHSPQAAQAANCPLLAGRELTEKPGPVEFSRTAEPVAMVAAGKATCREPKELVTQVLELRDSFTLNGH